MSAFSADAHTVEANPKPLDVALVDVKRTNKPADPGDLIALATEVSRASDGVRATACSKLRQISVQIRVLQQQANAVLEEAKRDSELHQAACNMVKKPGNLYHLYRRTSGQTCLSMLSPKEWGASCPHEFLGSYKLEWDHSWTPVDEIPTRQAEDNAISTILYNKLALPDIS